MRSLEYHYRYRITAEDYKTRKYMWFMLDHSRIQDHSVSLV